MARTVELLLDEELDAEVRRVWAVLEAAGLPSQSLHPHESNRPHLTLGVANELVAGGEAELGRALRRLPLRLRLDGLVVFGGRRRTLAWLVTPSPGLVDLHAGVAQALAAYAPAPSPQHLPGRWTPHVTLAARLEPQERAAALDALDGLRAVEGSATGARSYDTSTRSVTPLV
ncbi:2'-5' RNA ligase family protein [Motilibacter aurantiacus]|uniref:2'-5' RNA ligase family protein n=1 Tax=Motilibacter aurantiacus TaxID=2714955 RepID=UPI00140BD372|nr:2'-5' RNA ligase family protein [Motilibacter aurantiacus]